MRIAYRCPWPPVYHRRPGTSSYVPARMPQPRDRSVTRLSAIQFWTPVRWLLGEEPLLGGEEELRHVLERGRRAGQGLEPDRDGRVRGIRVGLEQAGLLLRQVLRLVLHRVRVAARDG